MSGAEPEKAARSVIRAYDRYAPLYDRLYGAVLAPGRRALAEAVERFAAGRAISLLEVGVGTGLMLPLYPAAVDVTGVDISEAMLAKARRRAAGLPRSAPSLHRMDAERLEFADGAFDCVTLPYVLSVTPEPARLVAEVRRVCKRDGAIFVLNHFSGSRFWWLFERLASPLSARIGFRSDFRLDRYVTCHDWKLQDMRDVNLLGLSKLLTLRNG